MELYEIKSLIKYSYYRDKENWEQARLVAYLIAQTNSKKKLKLTDIIKFSWDNKKETDTSISKEQIEMLSKQAEEMERMLQNK